MTYLMLHQKEGIKFLQEHRRCILADEAGLGKTRQMLEAAKNHLKYRNVLVICPTSVVMNWYDEAKKWGFPESKLVVVGYEYQLLKQVDKLRKGAWAVIIVDEAHAFKNVEAQRTRALLSIIKGRDSFMWFASGTPLVKSAEDFFVMLSICEPGKHGKLKEFREKYCKVKNNQWKPGGVEYYGVKNEKILSALLSKVMIRRYKRDHVEDLPDKIVTKVGLDMGKMLPIFTDEGIIRRVNKMVEAGGGVVDHELAETMQELGIQKVPLIMRYIKDTLIDYPLVIFAHHRAVLYQIADSLMEAGKSVRVIIGGMDKETKHHYLSEFQSGVADHLVVGIAAGGIGNNMHRSSRCVVAELPWTWAALEQATDRLHRIGQKDFVNAYLMYARETFEENQLRAIEERKELTRNTVGL